MVLLTALTEKEIQGNHKIKRVIYNLATKEESKTMKDFPKKLYGGNMIDTFLRFVRKREDEMFPMLSL